VRQSGVLMHITSLPGPYGIGTMGKQAFAFVDFLKKAGQRNWQILPLNPTGYGDSPYQSCSTFAGNPYLIDLQTLQEEGLLRTEELEAVTWFDKEQKVDYGIQYNNKQKLLELAYQRFTDWKEYNEFCSRHSAWLADFSLFMALKEEKGGKPWYEWEEGLKFRNPDAIWDARQRLKERIRFFSFAQFLFFRQWAKLSAYCHENKIRIIGDVPIYVPRDSVDVWTNPELFHLDEKLNPTVVAGCPPDAFSEDGQLWGNPIYRWELIAQNGFSWWMRRMTAASKLYDVIRLDHFRGFEAYWAVPAGDTNARGGKWVKGPGMDFIRTLKETLPDVQIIAEDLGFLTQEVLDLRNDSGYPGMKVLGFAFDSRDPSEYLPHNHVKNAVCYTGTHDNMTTRQWFDTASEDAVAYAKQYMALSETEGLVWGTIRSAFSSVCDLCVVQMQDFLELGGESRMNFPGTLSDANWTWRMADGLADERLAQRIHELTKLYGRLGN